MMKFKSKTDKHSVKKKRERKSKKVAHVETDTVLNIEVDNRIEGRKERKEKSSVSKKRKNKVKNLVSSQIPKDEVEFEEKSDGVMDSFPSEAQDIQDFKEHGDADTRQTIKPCRSKKAKKKRIKDESFVKEVQNSTVKGGKSDQDEVYSVSSGDEDCSKGMKKWIMEYHQNRPGLKVLQHQIDDFITAHEEKLEEERREREARAAEGGWTVVVHHKGRKKTTDTESGIAVGSVAAAAVENKMAKKKSKEVGLDFYRFQKREAQRNELMLLQSKFEEDKKRLQQLRAARKFRPY